MRLLVMVCVVLSGVMCAPVFAAESSRTVVITGANRGIGLEFVRQYGGAGWRVIATCRSPAAATELSALAERYPGVSVARMDITDSAQVAALVEQLHGIPIDILLNNAALLGSRDKQAFGRLDFELFDEIYQVNAIGPMRVSEALLPNLLASKHPKIIVLGSAAGSITMTREHPDFYAYRASKAALHLLTHNLAIELADQGIVVGLINPGLVDTRGLLALGPDDPVPEDFQQIIGLVRSGAIPLITPEKSVGAMITLINGLDASGSGKFLNYDGQELPW